MAGGEQPRVRRPPRAGRLDASTRCAPREQEDWFDPEGFLLAFDDDGLAGFCWTKVHPPHPPREPDALGEIYVIGADPRRQGIGLGRALTVGGLASLAERGHHASGCSSSTAPTTAAVGLYRALGFVTHRIDRAYGCDVDAAVDDRRTTRVRRDTAPRSTRSSPSWGEPRYRADQVWDALYRQQRRRSTTSPTLPARAARRARRRAARSRSTSSPRQTAARRA